MTHLVVGGEDNEQEDYAEPIKEVKSVITLPPTVGQGEDEQQDYAALGHELGPIATRLCGNKGLDQQEDFGGSDDEVSSPYIHDILN